METFRRMGLPVDEAYQGGKLLIQFSLVGMGIFGNMYTIYCVFAKSKLQRVTNIFIVVISLALMVQSGNTCIDLYNHFYNRDYYVLSAKWCKTWQTMNIYLPSMFGFLSFFAILDRYLILEHPGIHGKIMNRCTVVPILLFTFIWPAVASVPPIYLDWHTDDPYMPWGECKFKITVQYALLSPLVTFWPQMILVGVVILKLFRAMERHDKVLALLSEPGEPLTKEAEAARERAVQTLPWPEDQIRRQHRLAITLWSIYWNISIFWIPNHVWMVVYKLTGADWPRATNFIPWFGAFPSSILPPLWYYYDIYDI